MIRSLSFYRGIVIGAGLMYFLDLQQGRTRRTLVHRARGAVAQTAARVRHDHPDDRALAERVRAKLGRCVSHPHAIEVEAEDGCVTLSGPILRKEAEPLISAISTVPGVSEVVNQLEQHETAENISSLRGVSRFATRMSRRGPASRGPGMQLVAGAASVLALTYAASRIVQHLGGDGDVSRLEEENPEYAMLR